MIISPQTWFFIFFLAYTAVLPTITLFIITQTNKCRQAILVAFLFFWSVFTALFFAFLGIARSDGQYEILTAVVPCVLHRERGYGQIKGKHDVFFRQRLHRVHDIFAVHRDF